MGDLRRLPTPVLPNTLLLPLDKEGAPDSSEWALPWTCLTRAEEQVIVDAAAQLRLSGQDATSVGILNDVLLRDIPASVILRAPHVVYHLLRTLHGGVGTEDACQCLLKMLRLVRSELSSVVAMDGHAKPLPSRSSLPAAAAEALASLASARAAAALAARFESHAAVRDYLHGSAAVSTDEHYSHAATLRRTQASPAPLVAARRAADLLQPDVEASPREGVASLGSVAGCRERFLPVHPLHASLPPEPFGALGAAALALVDSEYHLRFMRPQRPPLLPRAVAASPDHSRAVTYLRASEAQLLARPSLLDWPVPLHRACAAIAEGALLALGDCEDPGRLGAPLAALACSALELAIDPALSYVTGHHDDRGTFAIWPAAASECAQALLDAAAATLRAVMPTLPMRGSPLAMCEAIEGGCPGSICHVLLPGLVESLLCGLPLDAMEADDATISLQDEDPSRPAYASPELLDSLRLKRCSIAMQRRIVRIPPVLVLLGEAFLLLLQSVPEGLSDVGEPFLLQGWTPGDPRLARLTSVLARLGSPVPAELRAAIGLARDARVLLASSVGIDVVAHATTLPDLLPPRTDEKAAVWDGAFVLAAVDRAVRVSLVHPGVGAGLAQSAASVLLSTSTAVENRVTPCVMAVAALLMQVLMVHPSPMTRVQALAALVGASSDQLGSREDSEGCESVLVAPWVLQPLVFSLLVDQDSSVASGAMHALDSVSSFCLVWLRCSGTKIPAAVAEAAPLLEVAARYLATLEPAACQDVSRRLDETVSLVRRRQSLATPANLRSIVRALFSPVPETRSRAVDDARAAVPLIATGFDDLPEGFDPVESVVAACEGMRGEELPTGTLESAAAIFLAELRLNAASTSGTAEVKSKPRPSGLGLGASEATCDPNRINRTLAAAAVWQGQLRARPTVMSTSFKLPDDPGLGPELVGVLIRAMQSGELPAPHKASLLHQLRDAVLRDAATFSLDAPIEAAFVFSAHAIIELIQSTSPSVSSRDDPADSAVLVAAAAGALHALVVCSPACRAELRDDAGALQVFICLAFHGPTVSSSVGSPSIDAKLLAVRCLARLVFEFCALTGGIAAGLECVALVGETFEDPRLCPPSAVLVPLSAWRAWPHLRSAAVAGGSSGALWPGLCVVDAAQPIYLDGALPPERAFVVRRRLHLPEVGLAKGRVGAHERNLADARASLALATSSRSPATFLSAVRALRLACESHSALPEYLQRSDIMETFYRFLSVSPQTPSDAACLAEILLLLESVLTRGPRPVVPEAWQARAWALLALCDSADLVPVSTTDLRATPAPATAELAEYVIDPHSTDPAGPNAGLPTVFFTADAQRRKADIRGSFWHHEQPRWRLIRAVLAFAWAATKLGSGAATGPGGRSEEKEQQLQARLPSCAAELIETTTILRRVLRLLALPELDALTQAACLRFCALLFDDGAAVRAAMALQGGRLLSAILRAAVARCDAGWQDRGFSFVGTDVRRAALRVIVTLAKATAEHTTISGEIPVLLDVDTWRDPATGSLAWLGRLSSHHDEESRLAYYALLSALLCTPATWAAFSSCSCTSQAINYAFEALCSADGSGGGGAYEVAIGATADTLRVAFAAADFCCAAIRAGRSRAWAGSAAPCGLQTLMSAQAISRLLMSARGKLDIFPDTAVPPLLVVAALCAHAPRRLRSAVDSEFVSIWTSTGLGDALFERLTSAYRFDDDAIARVASTTCRDAAFAWVPSSSTSDSFVACEAAAAAIDHAMQVGARTASAAFSLMRAVTTGRESDRGLGMSTVAIVSEAARVLLQYSRRCCAKVLTFPEPSAAERVLDESISQAKGAVPAMQRVFEHEAAVDACRAISALLVSWASNAERPAPERKATFPLAFVAALPADSPINLLGRTILRLVAVSTHGHPQSEYPPRVRIAALELFRATLVSATVLDSLPGGVSSGEAPLGDGSTSESGCAVLRACGWFDLCDTDLAGFDAGTADSTTTSVLFAIVAALFSEASLPPRSITLPQSSEEALETMRRAWVGDSGDRSNSSLPLSSAVAAVSLTAIEPREAWIFEGFAITEGSRSCAPRSEAVAALVAALECEVPVCAPTQSASLTVSAMAAAAADAVDAVGGLLVEISCATEELRGLVLLLAASAESDGPASSPQPTRTPAAVHVGVSASLHRLTCAASCLTALLLPLRSSSAAVAESTLPPAIAAAMSHGFASRVKGALVALSSVLVSTGLEVHAEAAFEACERVLGVALNFASAGGEAAGWHLAEHADVEARAAMGAGLGHDADSLPSSPASLPHRLTLRNLKPVFARGAATSWRALSLLDVIVSEAATASEALLPRPVKRGGTRHAMNLGCSVAPSSVGLLGAREARPPANVDGSLERRESRLRPASTAAVAGPRSAGLVAAVSRLGWRHAAERLHALFYAVLMASAHQCTLVRQAIVARQLPQLLCERLYWALTATLFCDEAGAVPPVDASASVAAVAATELRFLAACASPSDPAALDAVLGDAWFRRVTVLLLLRGPPAPAAGGRRVRVATKLRRAGPGSSDSSRLEECSGAELDLSAVLDAQETEAHEPPLLNDQAGPSAAPAAVATADCNARIAAAAALLRNCCGSGGGAAEDAWLYDDGVRGASLACLRDETVGVRICAATAIHGLVSRSARVRAWLKAPGREATVAAVGAAAQETAALIAQLGGGRPLSEAAAAAVLLLQDSLAQLEEAAALVRREPDYC